MEKAAALVGPRRLELARMWDLIRLTPAELIVID
jgi:hypothetical protein